MDEYTYAKKLAEILAHEHWPENTDWRPLDDTLGVLTQIDNMCTLMREQKQRIAELEADLHKQAKIISELKDDLAAAAAAGRTSPDEVFDALLGLIGLIRQNGDANVIFDERYKAAREVAKAYL